MKPRKDQRSDAALQWRKLHHSVRWRKLRRIHLAKEPLCRMCGNEGRLKAAYVVDHITPHKGDPALFYDPANWQSLCSHHHSSVKQSEERRSQTVPKRGTDGWPLEQDAYRLGQVSHPEWFTAVVVPLTIVCGAPASGKTTYVAQHKQPGDIVLDLDSIASKRFGRPVALLSIDQRLVCIEARNKQLGDLMLPSASASCGMAWLIVGEPSATKRQWWQDKLKPVRIVVLETPADECIARAKADTKQQRPAQVADAIKAWWNVYTKRGGEQAIRPASHADNA